VRLLIFFSIITVAAPAQDVKEIFRRAVEKDERNYTVRDQYTYREETIVEFFEKDGKSKSVERTTKDILFYDGTQLEKVVARNGQPLSARDLKMEQDKLDKEIARIKKESPAARAKRRGETAAELKEETEGRRQLLEAFDLQLKGESTVNQRPCWLITGTPRADFRPKGRRADQLKKFRGDACIDKETSDWMRIEVQNTETISFGLFLVRLQPGATVRIDQTRVNNEVCFPEKLDIAANARLLGMMRRAKISIRNSDFRKFSADSTITFETPSTSTQN
jgi:predicted RNA-binding protein with PIN domain